MKSQPTNRRLRWLGALNMGVRVSFWNWRYLWLASAIVTGAALADEPSVPFTTAISIRSLSQAEAGKGYPVRLRATVTFVDTPGAIFVQDDTAGTFFRPQPGLETLQPGDVVEVIGKTHTGLYLPGIAESPYRIVGRAPLPQPIAVRYDDLLSGRYHYQRVVIEGVVRSVASDDVENSTAQSPSKSVLRVAMGGRVVAVRVGAELEPGRALIDSKVRLTALVVGSINSRRQLVEPYLRMADWSSMEILASAMPDEAVPAISSAEMLTFQMVTLDNHRVRLSGVATTDVSEGLAYMRSDAMAFAVRFLVPTELKAGDRIEVIGFPQMERYSALLADARLMVRRPGEDPIPVEVELDGPMTEFYDGELVAFTANVTDFYHTESGPAMTLQRGGRAIQVRGALSDSAALVGSTVRVVGICLVKSVVGRSYNVSPDVVVIRVRGKNDITVLQSPSAWTAGRLAKILAVFVGLILVAALWIAILRRQVARQTATLRVKISSEAVLEERQRIAREFHDSLEQDLAGLNLRLDAMGTRALDEKGRTLLNASRNLVAHIQDETRNLISDLRSSSESAGDLVGSLQELVANHYDHPGIEVVLVVHGEIPHFPARVVHHLRMAVGEGVTNALKHAQATRIEVSVRWSQDTLLVNVTDNGKGFDFGALTRGKPGHFGCVGIRERCRMLLANATWSPVETGGTRLQLELLIPKLASN